MIITKPNSKIITIKTLDEIEKFFFIDRIDFLDAWNTKKHKDALQCAPCRTDFAKWLGDSGLMPNSLRVNFRVKKHIVDDGWNSFITHDADVNLESRERVLLFKLAWC